MTTLGSNTVYSVFGDHPDLGELVERFIDELPDRLKVLEQQFVEHRFDELAGTAQQLRGSVGNYGFDQVGPYAARLEQAARRREEKDSIVASLTELTSLCRRLRARRPE